MRRELLMLALASFATVSVADDLQSQVPGAVSASQRAARPRQVASGTVVGAKAATFAANPAGATNSAPAPSAASAPSASTAGAAADGSTSTSAEVPKFVSEAKWQLAGYNNDEIVYTVFVTNQDTRIIRCTTEVKGFYFENGAKLSIADRQITTVFPNEPTRVGYWMDMDQQSGASYSVKCHAV
jgi:hypothetical protein